MIGMALGALWTYTEIRECRDSFWYDFLFIVVTTGFVLYLWDIRFDGIFANSYPKSPYQFPVTTLFIATSLFTITKTRFIGRMLDNRITKHIAKISYSLYLWHALVIGLLCKWFFGDEGLENITWWTLVIVTLIISIPLAWLSEKYIEQGVMNWKKKVFPK